MSKKERWYKPPDLPEKGRRVTVKEMKVCKCCQAKLQPREITGKVTKIVDLQGIPFVYVSTGNGTHAISNIESWRYLTEEEAKGE